MDKEYIMIVRDCDKKPPFRIDLTEGTKESDAWDYSRIKANQIIPYNISAVSVGPRTVFEYYEAIDFSSTPFRVINDTYDQIKVHNFECADNNSWKGTLKSFIIMTFDHYDKVYGTRHCDSHNECIRNEMCLCPDGHEHPSWCTKNKRRCMSWNYFVNESPIPILGGDNIYMDCLADQMKLFSQTNPIKYEIIKQLSTKCALDKRKSIENFDIMIDSNNNWTKLVLIFMCVILLFTVCKYHNLF